MNTAGWKPVDASKAIRFHAIKAASLLVVGAAVSWTDFNFNMLVGGIAAIAVLYGMGQMLFSIRRPWSVIAIHATSAAAAVLLLAASIATRNFQEAQLDARLQPVIGALEAYHQAEGTYPESLKELTPRYLDSVPDCPCHGLLMYSKDGDGFSLTCVTFGFNKRTFDSRWGRWRNWD